MSLNPHTIKRIHFFLTAALFVASASPGAAKGAPATVRAGSAPTAPILDASEIDDPQFLVIQHYRDFLNREPDAAGLQFWTNNIESCGSDQQCREVRRVNTSAAFFLSIEFQETGYLVYRMYKAAYGNMAGAPVPLRREEFLPDTQQVGQGVQVGIGNWRQQLEDNKASFANAFVARSRFTTAFPSTMTASQFVDALNTNAGGALSQAERNQLVSDLTSGAKTRAQALRAVAEDPDLARQEFNRAFVLQEYFGYLRRNPNGAPDANFDGYNFWLAKLDSFSGDFARAEMVKAFLVSLEYRTRFVAPQPVTQVITPGGGTVAQPGFASVTFPAGSFAANTQVNLSATHTAETQVDFQVTAEIFSAGLRTPFEVRVNSGAVAPAANFDAVIQVPDNFIRSMPADGEIKVFAQVFQDGGEEVLDSFELFDSTFDAAAKTIRVTLPKEAFTNRRRTDETFEAVVVVGTTPTRPTTSPVVFDPSFLGHPSPLDVQFPSAEVPVQAALAADCEGTSLGSPLQGTLTVTGPFNPPGHKGVDYRAATGDNVLAAADGKITKVGLDSRPLTKPDPRSGKLVKGWGRYVLLTHTDGSQTLYAHLVTDSVGPADVGKVVTKGDILAKANNSGGSSAPHLHMEYAPNGKFFEKGLKVDPHPCIGTNVSGSITVRDNGTLADDAFRVSLDGTVLGTTAIGASNTFAVNNIRSGNHTLSILCVTAPDNVGTYEVTLSQGLTFSGGGTSRSGTLAQGASIPFTINAPTR